MPGGEKLSIPQFAAKIKEKYPEYADVNDTLLTNKIIEKYPEYKDKVAYDTPTAAPKIDGLTPTSTGEAPPKNKPLSQFLPNGNTVKGDIQSFKGSQNIPSTMADKSIGQEGVARSAASKELVNEAVKNTVKKRLLSKQIQYKEGDINYKKEFEAAKRQHDNGELATVHDVNGNPQLARKEGVGESILNAIISGVKEPLNSWQVNKIQNPKELSDRFDQEERERPEVVESVPSEFGQIVGGVVKPMAELAVPYAGQALMVGESYFNSIANKRRELYFKGIQDGLPREEAAKKAIENASNAALPEAASAYALSKTPSRVSEAASNGFAKSLEKSIGHSAQTSLLFGGAAAASKGIEKAQGYEVSAKEGIESFINGVSDGAKMELALKAGFAVPHSLKILKAASKEVLSHFRPDEIAQKAEELGLDPNEVKAKMQQYDAVRESIKDLVPEEHVPFVAGLVEKQINLKNEIKDLENSKFRVPEPLHDKIDDQVKAKQQEITSLNGRIKDMSKSENPIEHEVDDATGDKVVSDIKDSEIKKTFDELSPHLKDGKEVAQNVIDRVNNADYINEHEINKATDVLYDAWDKSPEARHLIEPLINKLENYEFTTETKTSNVTEKVSVDVARPTRKPTVANKSLEQWEGNRAAIIDNDGKRTEGILKAEDGNYYLYNNDGEKVAALGEKAITNRDVTLPEGEISPIEFDAEGNVKAITLQLNKTDTERGGTIPDKKITIQFKDKDKALDYAIQLRAEQVGEVPMPEFETIFKDIERQVSKEVLKSNNNEEAKNAIKTQEVNDTGIAEGSSEVIPPNEVAAKEQGSQEAIPPNVNEVGQGDAKPSDAVLDKTDIQKMSDKDLANEILDIHNMDRPTSAQNERLDKLHDEAANRGIISKLQEVANETSAENNTENKPLEQPTEAQGNTIGEPNTEGQAAKEGGGEPPKENAVTVTQPNGETVGITHASMDKLAEELGLPDRYEKDPTTVEAWDKEASEKIAKGEMPLLIEKLEKTLKDPNNKSLPGPTEQRMLLQYVSGLKAEYDAKPSDKILAEFKRVKELSDIVAGRFVGQSLQARKGEIGVHPLDGGIASAMVAKMEANNTDKLTDTQKKQVEDLISEYKKTAENEAAKRKGIEEKYNAFLAEKELAATKKSTPRKPRTKEEYAKERKDILESIKDKWKNASKDGTLTAVPVPYAKQLMAIAPDVAKLVKSLVSEGIEKLDDVVSNVHLTIKEAIPELTERDVRDIIAGHYNEKKETKNDLQAKIFEIRQEQKLLDEYEKALRDEPKTEKAKQAKNEKLAALRNKINEVRKENLEANNFFGESDKGEKRIQDLEDELDRVRARKEKVSEPKEKKELSDREQSLVDDIADEKKLWAKEKATDRRVKELEAKLEDVRKRKVADPKYKTQKEVSPQEQELLDKIDAEKEVWANERDAARQSKREYQKLETERNRQLQRVADLNEKLAELKKGKLVQGKRVVPKEDTAEIEALKKQVADAEKEIRQQDAHQEKMKGLEKELQRLKDRKEKEKKPENKKAMSAEEKDIRSRIESERDAWTIEKNIAKLETELLRVKYEIPKEPSKVNKRELTDTEKDLVKRISEEKRVQSINNELRRVKERKEKAASVKEQQELSVREQELMDNLDAEKEKWATEEAPLRKILAIKNANTKAAEKILKRIENKDFSTKEKPKSLADNFEFYRKYPSEYTAAMNAIKAKEEAKKAFDLAMLRDEMAHRTPFEKFKDGLAKVRNTSTATVAGVDNSLMFVQLGYTLLRNPKTAINFRKVTENGKTKFVMGGALKANVLDAISKQRFEMEMTALHESAAWPLIKSSGLDILEPQSLLDKQREELFQHNFAGKIGIGKVNLGNFYSVFERAYTSLGNHTRVDLFLRKAKDLQAKGMTFENSPEEYKGIARAINNLTGRGSVNAKIAQGLPLATTLAGTWSPKMLASSLNLLGLSDVMGKSGGYYSKLPPAARKYAASQMAGGLGIGISIMAAAAVAGHTVHYDPRDVRFGDVEYDDGKKAFNVFGRFAGVIRTVAHLIPSINVKGYHIGGGTVKDGVYSTIYDKGGKTGGKEIYGFFRGKMNPLHGLVWDYLANDKTGYFDQKQIDAKTAAQSLVVPMSLRNVNELLTKDGTQHWYEFLLNFNGVSMKNQLDYYENQWKDSPEGKFLQNNMIKVPSSNTDLMKLPKDDKHPDGKMTDDESEKFIKAKDEIMKKGVSTIMKQGWYKDDGVKVSAKYLSLPANKELLQDAVKYIADHATDEAKDKVFPDVKRDVREEAQKRGANRFRKNLLRLGKN